MSLTAPWRGVQKEPHIYGAYRKCLTSHEISCTIYFSKNDGNFKLPWKPYHESIKPNIFIHATSAKVTFINLTPAKATQISHSKSLEFLGSKPIRDTKTAKYCRKKIMTQKKIINLHN